MLEKTLTAALENRCASTATIVRDVARRFGVPRKTVYALALKIRQEVDTGGDGSQP